MRRLRPLVSVVLLLGLWQFVSRTGSEMIPPPAVVLLYTAESLRAGDLSRHVLASVVRVLAGFTVAAAAAIPLALLLAVLSGAARALAGVLEWLRPIPPIAWIPLAVLWFGIGNPAAVFIVAVAAFYPIFTSVYVGVADLPPIYRQVASNFGANRRLLLTDVLVPAVLPGLLVGVRVAVGIAWASVVAAEMIGAQSGLGYSIQQGRLTLDYERVVSGMMIIGMIGYGSNAALLFLARAVRARKGFAPPSPADMEPSPGLSSRSLLYVEHG